MAQGLKFVEYVKGKVAKGCKLSHKMMFGGCALYQDGMAVALIGDDQLFVKPTSAEAEEEKQEGVIESGHRCPTQYFEVTL